MSDTFIEQECGSTYVEAEGTRTLVEEGGQNFIVESCKQGVAGFAPEFHPAPIPPSTTEVVDSLDITEFMAAKWFVHMTTDEGTPRYRAVEVYGLHNSTTAFNNLTSIVGEVIAAQIVVDLNGTDLELKVTNNEAVDLIVRLLRMAICV